MVNFWLNLKRPITVLAPMDDVTDFVFRELIASIAKPDVLFTEFTSTDGLFTKGHAHVARRLDYSSMQHPIVAQIWGSTPEKFLKAASYIEELGFDGIDINMGCPVKNITQKNSGASLISNKTLVSEIIDAVKTGAPNIPLSVKTRLAKNTETTNEWLEFLLSKNIEVLILHGRTAKEKSKVVARWDEIGNAVTLRTNLNSKTLIIGNGDVKSYSEVVEKHLKYGVDGVMIGRGIFQNPWVFDRNLNEIKRTTKDYLDLLLMHTKLFNDKWGKTKNFDLMKKFFKVYIKEFKGADQLRQDLMATKNYEEFLQTITHALPNE